VAPYREHTHLYVFRLERCGFDKENVALA
jgi:hypothetical protein